METRSLTIMFADLAGYTSKTARSTRTNFMLLLDNYEKIVEPIFAEFYGTIVKKLGDGFLVAFESPTNAVLCGIKIQDSLFNYNKTISKKDRLNVRVAISTGEVQIRKNDVYGETVNIASRLEQIARPHDVYFTESVYLAMNKAEIPSRYFGAFLFKGIPRRVKVFKVLGKYSQILIKRKRRQEAIASGIKMLIATTIILLILMAIGAYLYITYYGLP